MTRPLFDPLVQAWKDGDASLRASATLELRNLSGTPLGWNRTGRETDLVLLGDGSLHYFRRGATGGPGGSGDGPPGMWQGACDPSEVDALWRALEGLSGKDFQGSAVDPGGGKFRLQAQCGGLLALVDWAPGGTGMERKGIEALAPLRRLEAMAREQALWTFGLRAGEAARVSGGISIPLEIFNEGIQPVPFLISPPGLGADLSFRFAVATDQGGEDRPSLPVDWMDADLSLPGESSLRLASLDAGGSFRLETRIAAELRSGVPYLGQFAYRQLSLGERVAGRPAFAGESVTDGFRFTVPD